MDFLLNLLFGILAFFGVRWLCAEIGLPHPVPTIIGVIAGILVFFANLAAQLVR